MDSKDTDKLKKRCWKLRLTAYHDFYLRQVSTPILESAFNLKITCLTFVCKHCATNLIGRLRQRQCFARKWWWGAPWGLIYSPGRVIKQDFNGQVSWWFCIGLLATIFENKLVQGQLQGENCVANNLNLDKDRFAWILHWISDHWNILSLGLFASSISHSKLECAAFFFLRVENRKNPAESGM